MVNLKSIIETIENHTGEKFDFTNRRHKFHLDEIIKREITKRDRKLELIRKALNSTNEDSIYDSTKQYTRNR